MSFEPPTAIEEETQRAEFYNLEDESFCHNIDQNLSETEAVQPEEDFSHLSLVEQADFINDQTYTLKMS